LDYTHRAGWDGTNFCVGAASLGNAGSNNNSAEALRATGDAIAIGFEHSQATHCAIHRKETGSQEKNDSTRL